MPLYEVVLRLDGAEDEVRLHDRRLGVGDTIVIRGREWIVDATERPKHPDALRRYVCRPADAERG